MAPAAAGLFTSGCGTTRSIGFMVDTLAEFKQVQEENRRLRHLVAELSLDNAALKELQRGKW